MKKIVFFSMLFLLILFLGGCKTQVSEQVQELQTKYGDCHPPTEAEKKFMEEYNLSNEQAKIGLKGDYENKISACTQQTVKDRCENETFDFKGLNFNCGWK